MVWDLRGALLKKEEFETARLANFDFRLRARTMRLLAPILGLPVDELVQEIAFASDDAMLRRLKGKAPDVKAQYERCRTRARIELIQEIGDPTPHSLA